MEICGKKRCYYRWTYPTNSNRFNKIKGYRGSKWTAVALNFVMQYNGGVVCISFGQVFWGAFMLF